MPPEMLRTLLSGMAAFTLLYLGFVTVRYGLACAANLREGSSDARLRPRRTGIFSWRPTPWRR